MKCEVCKKTTQWKNLRALTMWHEVTQENTLFHIFYYDKTARWVNYNTGECEGDLLLCRYCADIAFSFIKNIKANVNVQKV